MSRMIEILTGDEALERLQSPETLARWSAAAAADPKSTWFQESPFVLSWYGVYSEIYEPVVAIESDGDRIAGLLAIARHRDSNELVHAGGHHAWYHGWIARPGAESFATEATGALVERFRPAVWRWKFLPPGADAAWAEDGAFGAVVEEHRSAVWELSDEDAISRHESRGLRNYMNRYRREGELRLEQLTDPGRIERALRVLAPWCDLRHGAIHADLPFRDDPCKLPFHQALALADPSVQTCVLRLDDRPLAVHLGAFDGTRLFLGLHGYDPTEGRQSPGTILLLELAHQVRAQGGVEIDMTPGGEAWKERYASRHRAVFRVDVYGDATRRTLRSLGDRLTGLARGALETVGLQPDDVRRVVGGEEREPAAAATVFEVDHHYLGEVDAGADHDSFDAVEAAWLEQLLSHDDRHQRAETSRFLSFALRLLDKGWRPLCSTASSGAPTIAWLQPNGSRAQLPRSADVPPRVVRGALEAGAEASAVPEDAALLLLTEDGGGPAGHPLPLLVEAARRAGKSRIWVAAIDATPSTRAWLLENGRPVGGAERAA